MKFPLVKNSQKWCRRRSPSRDRNNNREEDNSRWMELAGELSELNRTRWEIFSNSPRSFPRVCERWRAGHAYAFLPLLGEEYAEMLPTRRKFAICKPLGLSSIRNDTSSARSPLFRAPYGSAKWLGQGFTREISRGTRCSNARKIRATSGTLSGTLVAH